MKIRERLSRALYNQAEKRGWVEDIASQTIRWGGYRFGSENVMQSSDVNELVEDILNQIALAEPVIIGPDGKEIKDNWALDIIKNPNHYLTGFEFAKLMVNTYLIDGEIYPILMNNELHLANNVETELTENLTEKFKVNGTIIPGTFIRHIKKVSTSYTEGQGLADLGRNTLEGVMNAEKSLTDKYAKGGLLAFLLKLDAQINPKNGSQSQLVKAIVEQLSSMSDSSTVKMIPLGRGYDIEALKSPVEDEKILAYLNVYKKDLGKYLGINVDTYQGLMKMDVEKAMMYLHNKTVKPILKNLEDHFSLLFFGPKSGYRIKWKINILDFVTYSNKTNIGYNIVRAGITSPDEVAKMLGFEPQNTPESQAIYIAKDLTQLGTDNATNNSVPTGGDDQKGGDQKNDEQNYKNV